MSKPNPGASGRFWGVEGPCSAVPYAIHWACALRDLYLMGMYLMGVYLMGVYLMGVHLIDVYFRFSVVIASGGAGGR